jgi:hypothetical protein
MQIEIKKDNLKTFFIMLGLWLVTIICIIFFIINKNKHQGDEYAAVATPYIEQAIEKISQWDPTITRALMAPEISKTISEERLVQTMIKFSKLGPLLSMEAPEFEKLYSEETGNIGKQTILEYKVDAKYENGDAFIAIKLLVREDSFDLYPFNISSAALAE